MKDKKIAIVLNVKDASQEDVRKHVAELGHKLIELIFDYAAENKINSVLVGYFASGNVYDSFRKIRRIRLRIWAYG